MVVSNRPEKSTFFFFPSQTFVDICADIVPNCSRPVFDSPCNNACLLFVQNFEQKSRACRHRACKLSPYILTYQRSERRFRPAESSVRFMFQSLTSNISENDDSTRSRMRSIVIRGTRVIFRELWLLKRTQRTEKKERNKIKTRSNVRDEARHAVSLFAIRRRLEYRVIVSSQGFAYARKAATGSQVIITLLCELSKVPSRLKSARASSYEASNNIKRASSYRGRITSEWNTCVVPVYTDTSKHTNVFDAFDS